MKSQHCYVAGKHRCRRCQSFFNDNPFPFKQCWNFQCPWWAFIWIPRCFGVLRCCCYLVLNGSRFWVHCFVATPAGSHSPLSAELSETLSVLINHNILLTSHMRRTGEISLFRRAQASQAGTHTHSPFWSHWLTNHKYPDSALCTQQSRKDGLKILVGFWLAGFLSKWFSLLQEPVDPLSPGCLSRRCQPSGFSMATKPQQNLFKSNPSAEMFGTAWWTFPDQLSRYVWVHVATWVKDTISSPQMSTLIFLCALRRTLLPLTLSPCCAAGGGGVLPVSQTRMEVI